MPCAPPNASPPRLLALLTGLGLLALALVVVPASADDDQATATIGSIEVAEAGAESRASVIDWVLPETTELRAAQTAKGTAVEIDRPEADELATKAAAAQVEPVPSAAAEASGLTGPMAMDDVFLVDLNSGPNQLDVLSNDSFGTLLEIITSEPIGGTVDCDLDSCLFHPDVFYGGNVASFDYAIVDETGTSEPAMVDIELNSGPFPPDRFFETTPGVPIGIDLLEGAVDPEGDLFVVERAQMIEGVGTFEILDGQTLLYTPPVEPSDTPFAGIDVFYRDARGAFGAGFVGISIEPFGPSCDVVEVFVDQLLVNRPGDRSHMMATDDLTCPLYDLALISFDPRHEPGYQVGQDGERWFAEGLDANGDVVYTSPVTPDLPDEEQIGLLVAGPVDPTAHGIVAWRVNHAGQGGANSIAATLVLVPPGLVGPPACDGGVVFDQVELLNRSGDTKAYATTNTVGCPHMAYVRLVSSDLGHSAGYQPNQTEEIWVLEGLDYLGNVLVSLESAPDLADDQTYAERVTTIDDVSRIDSWRIRHGATGANINSIDVTVEIAFR